MTGSTDPHDPPSPAAAGSRDAVDRVRDTLDRLGTERDVWVCTAHPDHGPHQVPLWFVWDGEAFWLSTAASSATARNVGADARVRLALPDTQDVVLVDGTACSFTGAEVPAAAGAAFAARIGWDPRAEGSPYVFLRVDPRTVRAWRGESELRGRVIMRRGAWLG